MSQQGVSSRISDHVARVTAEYTGRGPIHARTVIQGNLVATLLSGTLAKGERVLASRGEEESVRAMRRSFQVTMREELVAGVEAILGRRVIAFMSDNAVEPDYAVEVFVLADGAGVEPELAGVAGGDG